jgi:hypothetical protein
MDNGDEIVVVDECFGDVWDEKEKENTSSGGREIRVFDAFVDEQCSGRCYHVKSRFSSITVSLPFEPHLPL